ncbi:unnamed protein product [Rotaria sordida]|uniref:Secretory carrier-associated membrane protein n=1 Tax=Rotaria sordida TaxID=392033 RepID=A0A818VSN0_9BILA|nr:unnamed protein product [Rotaria sordida]CAF3754653.1 unnamed protein product [Rotaria sordida]
MNYNDDYNPFADSSIQQATASSFSNQQPVNEYNPFAKTATTAQPAPPPPPPSQQPNIAAVLPPTQPATYQSPFYASSAPPPNTVQRPIETPTRVDLSQYERQQAELEQREKRLTDRERALSDSTKLQKREKNFPPLPKFCPCGPCFYQDINIEIPSQFQIWVRYLYYLWLMYSATLFLNMIAALSYFVVDKNGAATFGLSLVYLFLFIPSSYICWFRPIYRAFSGFILMIKLFTAGGSKIAVGLIVMIVTFSFALVAAAGGLLLIKVNGFARLGLMATNKAVGTMMIILGSLWSLISLLSVLLTIRVHRLYRQSGASLEQAQREFQSAFVNNPTVRGAAREVATAGINEAVRSNDNQQRPIY